MQAIFVEVIQNLKRRHIYLNIFFRSSNTYRVYSLDIHKTKYLFHSSVTITDGISLRSKDHGVKTGKWVFRDHFSSKVVVVVVVVVKIIYG